GSRAPAVCHEPGPAQRDPARALGVAGHLKRGLQLVIRSAAPTPSPEFGQDGSPAGSEATNDRGGSRAACGGTRDARRRALDGGLLRGVGRRARLRRGWR
ncbi:MAG: hypothetical protein ACE5E6_12385, partial [Phycisphaerae bacterium]